MVIRSLRSQGKSLRWRGLVAGAIVWLAAAPAQARRLPVPPPPQVAAHVGDQLYVVVLLPGAATPASAMSLPALAAYGWSNPTTLWAVHGEGAARRAVKIEGRRITAEVALADLKVGAPGKELPSGDGTSPGIVITAGGEVYVTSCLGMIHKRGKMVCELGYTRVDDGSKTFAKKRPARVTFDWESPPVRKAPAAKAPTGYEVKLGTIKVGDSTYGGFTCTGPGGKKTSWPRSGTTEETQLDPDPRFVPAAKKVTWLASAPPLVHVAASGKTPIGEKLAEDVHVFDCARIVSHVLYLGERRWLIDGEVFGGDGASQGKVPGDRPVLSP